MGKFTRQNDDRATTRAEVVGYSIIEDLSLAKKFRHGSFRPLPSSGKRLAWPGLNTSSRTRQHTTATGQPNAKGVGSSSDTPLYDFDKYWPPFKGDV